LTLTKSGGVPVTAVYLFKMFLLLLTVIMVHLNVVEVRRAGKYQSCQRYIRETADYMLKETDSALADCKDSCFSEGVTSMKIQGNGSNSEISRLDELKLQLGELKTIVKQNTNNKGCSDQTFHQEIKSDNFFMLKQTQMSMIKTQSDFFRKLNMKEKVKYLEIAHENEDFALPNHCSLDFLIKCNENKGMIEKCFDTSVAYSDISKCLKPMCPRCAVALASLLGFNFNTMSVTRFIAKSKNPLSLRNILRSPHAMKADPAFEDYLYIDREGRLRAPTPHEEMTKKLAEHKKYWEAKLGKKIGTGLSRTAKENGEVVKTMIDSTDKLVDVIAKTKALYLGDLEHSIKSINTNIGGITAEAKKNIEAATSLLYTSEVEVQNTRAILDNLAEDTLERVKEMLHYVSKVKDDWSAERISKYLKFQAKKMTQLIERSLTSINDAEKLYHVTQENLAIIQAKLETFNKQMKNLADEKSAAYKKRTLEIRAAVYATCCLPVWPTLFACPVCVAVVETTISKWKSALAGLLKTIGNNEKVVDGLSKEAKYQKEKLGQEVGSLVKWSGALHRMSDTDWTFEEVEIFGFADVRPELVHKLNKLQEAAKNYLAINSKKK